MKIAPSLLDADFSKLQDEIHSLSGCDRIHIDVMDGQYVPKTSFISGELENLKFPTEIEAHLMVEHPEDYFDEFIELGCKRITFHIETQSEEETLELLEELKLEGIKAGICIDGFTSSQSLSDDVLDLADQILIMTVKAGKGGQTFMAENLEKIKELRARGYKGEIEIDGGVNDTNWKQGELAGADIAVVGSFLMKEDSSLREERIKKLKTL